MTTLHLYRSVIHDATFEFHTDHVFVQKRDIIQNKWHSGSILTTHESEKIAAYYHIDPLEIYQHLNEYHHLFQSNQNEAKTSWGATYYKHETDEHLWVERFKKLHIDVVIVQNEVIAIISPSRENISVLVKAGYE